MTTILAIETSTELASVALLTDGRLSYRELSGVQTHSQGILPLVQHILKDAGITLHDCDAIGFGCGPGAFTGVRTACGVVQGLAFGAELPVVPVITLQAMAEGARSQYQVDNVLCVLDARMEEVYWAHYRFENGAWQTLSEPALSSIAQLCQLVDFNQVALVAGQGVHVPDLPAGVSLLPCMPHAGQIAQLALLAFSAGKAVSAEQAQPLYLRNKVALTTEERMQVAQAKLADKGTA